MILESLDLDIVYMGINLDGRGYIRTCDAINSEIIRKFCECDDKYKKLYEKYNLECLIIYVYLDDDIDIRESI